VISLEFIAEIKAMIMFFYFQISRIPIIQDDCQKKNSK